jgi:predicted aspartyl protease
VIVASVEFEVVNNGDIEAVRSKLLAQAKVRRKKIQGLVDTGAHNLVLPKAAVEDLGLPIERLVKVTNADKRTAKRPLAEAAYVELLDRHSVFNDVIEPKRETAPIGAIVLEAMDLLVDPTNQSLIPRDPRIQTTEIE